LFDSLKYIPLNKQGDSYLTFGGQVRDRYEYFNNNLFGNGPQSPDGYNLIRVLLDADLHLSPYFRVLPRNQRHGTGSRRRPRPSDVNEIDLYQAFADLTFPITTDTSFTLRGGRQGMVLARSV